MTAQIAIWTTIIWFVFWWLYAIYDVLTESYYHFISDQLWGCDIPRPLQYFLKIIGFPIYVLYHCIVIILKSLQYICIDIFYEMIIMGWIGSFGGTNF